MCSPFSITHLHTVRGNLGFSILPEDTLEKDTLDKDTLKNLQDSGQPTLLPSLIWDKISNNYMNVCFDRQQSDITEEMFSCEQNAHLSSI